MDGIDRMSPRALARTAGLLYVLEGMTSVSGALLIPGRFVVPGDGAATAANILGNEPLYLLGITSSLVSVALHAALTAVLYELFKPAGRVVARAFAFIGLLAVALQAGSALLQLPAWIVLGGAGGTFAFGTEESQSLARASLSFRAHAFNLYLGFFGFRCALAGYLAWHSTFMPRSIGALMVVSGLGYLTFLWPPLANGVAPFNLVAAAPGELSFMFWLLLAGVNGERWKAQARAAAEARRRALE